MAATKLDAVGVQLGPVLHDEDPIPNAWIQLASCLS